ncbi:hypothetical protein ATANTOWER_032479 [Ataeniobius toweri]|uniref:Uncharacterized protein n=1 Tax=Ataeniobius toweri TaxID=208326 RepID=A0ABU7B0T8_9TELE|nr:hypothetical protein [Ataeniobius toweri]
MVVYFTNAIFECNMFDFHREHKKQQPQRNLRSFSSREKKETAIVAFMIWLLAPLIIAVALTRTVLCPRLSALLCLLLEKSTNCSIMLVEKVFLMDHCENRAYS